MRKVLLISALAVMSAGAFAQTEKGKVLVSGSSNLSFSSIDTEMEYDGEKMGDKVSVSNFEIKPSVGYFLSDNAAIVISMDYSSQEVEDYKSSSMLIGPGFRYYFGSTNIKPFILADLMIGSGNEENGTDEFKSEMFGYDLGGGVAIFLNDYVSIDLGLSYGSITATSKDDDNLKAISGGLGFDVGFSIAF